MFKKYEGEKKKQVLMVVGFVGLVMGALYLWNKVTGGSGQTQSQAPEIKITETEKIERAYEKGYEVRAREIEEKLEKLSREVTSLREENRYLRERLRRRGERAEERRETEKGEDTKSLIKGVIESRKKASSAHPLPPEGRGFIPPPPPPQKPT